MKKSVFRDRVGAKMKKKKSRNFCQKGPTLKTLYLVDEGRRDDPNTTKSGPLSARQRNAI